MSIVTVLRTAAVGVLVGIGGCAAAQEPVPGPAPLPDPVTACSAQLEYWAGELLREAPDEGFDYQHMGLTSGQSDALARIVERARAGEAVPPLARQECTVIAAARPVAPWGG